MLGQNGAPGLLKWVIYCFDWAHNGLSNTQSTGWLLCRGTLQKYFILNSKLFTNTTQLNIHNDVVIGKGNINTLEFINGFINTCTQQLLCCDQ